MATATKKAAAKKAPGKSLQKWDEQLAQRAAIARATADSVASGAKRISLKGGLLTVDDAQIPGNKMNVIVLDHCLENTFRTGDYDPDGGSDNTPVCFALGRDDKTMAPHEKSTEPQHDSCKGCPHAEWGSADKGKGKACKNKNRLMLITEGDLDDIAGAEVRLLTVPVMSGKAWNGYVKQLDDNFSRPPLGVVTEISVVPDPKSQFKLQFKLVEQLDDEYFEELFPKADAVEDDLMRPFEPREEEEEEAPRSRRTAVKKAGRKAPIVAAPIKKKSGVDFSKLGQKSGKKAAAPAATAKAGGKRKF